MLYNGQQSLVWAAKRYNEQLAHQITILYRIHNQISSRQLQIDRFCQNKGTMYRNPQPILFTVTLLAVGLILVLADRGALPGFVYALYAFPNGDKVGHVFVMGLLALGLNGLLCTPPAWPGWLLRPGSLLAMLLIILEEFSQRFFAARTFSWVDLGFSLLGVLCAELIIRLVRRGPLAIVKLNNR